MDGKNRKIEKNRGNGFWTFTLLVLFSGLLHCSEIYNYKIINKYPHDTKAFTQGLIYYDNYLFEGTGKYGKSLLRKIELQTYKILKYHKLPKNVFGEGITIFKNRIFQLTLRKKTGFIYNLNDFKLIKTFSYPGQGWGITNDEKDIIISDGTDVLKYLNPDTFQITKTIKVRDNKKSIKYLNELEFIDNKIYANIWKSSLIAIIDVNTGYVTGYIDLSSLLQNNNKYLNGIAYNRNNKSLYITGKYWPNLYEIEIIGPIRN